MASLKRFSLIAAAALAVVPSVLPQGYNTYGVNKVVRKDFDWKVSRTDHFDVYYYEGSAGWAPKAAEYLETAYRLGREKLGHAPTGRRPFFLYANVNDMEQSNIVTVGDGTGGVTEPYKNRFMAYNDGTERWLEDVITHEYGHIVEFSILTEGFWRSARILKTVFYPLWLMEGLSEYLTGGLDSTIEDIYIRDAATSKGLIPLTRLEATGHLKPHQVTLAYKEGAAAMRFLEQEYGRDKLNAFLEIFKTRFEANSVLGELIGLDLFAFDAKFREYLEDKYSHEVKVRGLREPEAFGRRRTVPEEKLPEFNTSPVLSRDGRWLAFLSTRDGFPARVDLMDLRTGRVRQVSGRPGVVFENIPQGNFTEISRNLALSPDGRTLAFGAQKNHRESLMLADLRTGEISRVRLGGFMTLQQPSFSPDGRRIAFSAMKDGFTDIYLYDRDSGRVEALTHDDADDQSPAFSPDGRSLVWSKELTDSTWKRPHQRDLYLMDLADRSSKPLTTLEGDERDPVFSPDGSRVLFTADPDEIDDLYELDRATGRIARLTRSVGGTFTPLYGPDGKEVFFSSFRRGSVHIYSGPRSGFLDEELPASAVRPVARAPEASGRTEEPLVVSLSQPRPYQPMFSTDLFLPAFFFSSQGGLYWTSYWQGSDFLGIHNTSAFLNYNSGAGLLDYQINYTYARYRPQWILSLRGFRVPDLLDDQGLAFTDEVHQQLFGVAYPLDRFHRLEILGGVQTERKEYRDIPQTLYTDGRLIRLGFIRDTVSGRYLVETEGSRLGYTYTHFFPVLGGNQEYTSQSAEAQKFLPLGGLSTLALRGLYLQSIGPQEEVFSIGGVGWVEGFQRSATDNAGSRAALANVEWRFPLVPELDYYMWYFSPDLYFKAIFGKLFVHSGYRWNDHQSYEAVTFSRLLTSVGFGIQVNTFVLQRFPFVVAIDIAKQLNTRNKVVYLYLGPTF